MLVHVCMHIPTRTTSQVQKSEWEQKKKKENVKKQQKTLVTTYSKTAICNDDGDDIVTPAAPLMLAHVQVYTCTCTSINKFKYVCVHVKAFQYVTLRFQSRKEKIKKKKQDQRNPSFEFCFYVIWKEFNLETLYFFFFNF